MFYLRVRESHLKTDSGPHIAIVVNSIEPGGGVSNVALAQAKALSQYFSVSLLCAHGSVNHKGIEVHRVAEPKIIWLRRFGHVVREYLLCRRFSSALCAISKSKPLNFVLFHSHSAAAMAKPKLGVSVPCGMVVHGDIFTRPKGSYDPLLTQFYKYSSKRAYQIIDLVIALSPSMRTKAIEYGADSRRVEVIPNGIDVCNTILEKSRKKSSEVIRLLFVGRLTVEKAPLVLLEAMTLLDTPAKLIMAGAGPLEQTIEQFITSHDLRDRVELLGHLASSEINYLYNNSDVLCVPSIDDPLPTAILEAMNAGVPVVASDVDGIPFMVEDGVSGLLVPPNEPMALSQAIIKLASSDQLRSDFARAAQQRIKDEFSLTAVTKRLVESIEKTMKDSQFTLR